ncbi:MAG: DUF4166 domain-containing protein [Chloroflexota bacterium]
MSDATPQPAHSGGQRTLYRRLLGPAWDDLAPSVQQLHGDAIAWAEGRFQVSRAPGRLLGLILDAARVPPVSDAVPVRLSVTATATGAGPVERWLRTFGDRPLVTVQYAAAGGLLGERAGILDLRLRLAAEDRALLFRQEGQGLWLGPWRLPLPDWPTIRVSGRASPVTRAGAVDGQDERAVQVEVRVRAPTGSLLFGYRGVIRFGSVVGDGGGAADSGSERRR